ncbi:lanthionine synthetase C family protein [Fodinicola acaciae]|uniref:lanthionine synthetase C family protein n=1 Tax=Fodinicola acaciae TaxID=2681555 RepID=UPI0013D263F0|nr:lanthionine synthetase C family protein [Fodinicola acaciae]
MTVVTTLSERLADPDAVFRDHTQIHESLLERQAGVALLYAELGHHDPACRQLAHRHLAAANQALRADMVHSLFDGIPAVAFAAAAAAHDPGDYADLLRSLDESVFQCVRTNLDAEQARLRDRTPLTSTLVFDLIGGLTGLGRYLLCRRHIDEAESLLRGILDYVALLLRPVDVAGTPLPGWWSMTDPAPSRKTQAGHANFGLAHGIPGPLALLAIAWRAGVRVPGQDATIEAIVEILRQHSLLDNEVRYWPDALRQAEGKLSPTPRSGEAWCYGRPGVVRAIQLAALALDRHDWTTFVRDAVRDLPALSFDRWRVRGTGLCHGWAGLLHVLGRIQADDPECWLGALVDQLAERTVAEFDPRFRFGYRQWAGPGRAPTDEPGLVTGAAGIALALHAYEAGRTSTGWDAALLLT